MSDTTTESKLAVAVNESDHTLGPATAPVMLVEYGDYECPHCRAAHLMLRQLLAQAGDSVCLIFRNFPLSQIHSHAAPAAEAAETAGAQGKFWQMHDMLFENQDALEDDNLLTYARALHLDMERFTSDFSHNAYEARIREDLLSGVRSGVNGTPTFFINGHRHDGSYELGSLLSAIEKHTTHSSHKAHHKT